MYVRSLVRWLFYGFFVCCACVCCVRLMGLCVVFVRSGRVMVCSLGVIKFVYLFVVLDVVFVKCVC